MTVIETTAAVTVVAFLTMMGAAMLSVASIKFYKARKYAPSIVSLLVALLNFAVGLVGIWVCLQ